MYKKWLKKHLLKERGVKRFNKIFAVGLNKTGTFSLHSAFIILGFRSIHCWDEEKVKIQCIMGKNEQGGGKAFIRVRRI